MSEKKNPTGLLSKEALQEKANAFFSENKDTKEVFLTADGFMFLKRNFANDHAKTLDGSEVFHFKKASSSNDAEHKTVQLTEEQKQLLESGLQKENYNAIKALVTVLKIEVPNQKAESLITALEKYKLNNPPE